MSEEVLAGRGRRIDRIPSRHWEDHLAQVPRHGKTRLGFMSKEHHEVRRFVVRELPRLGRPVEPARISGDLQLPVARVTAILDDLEKNLFFVVRNEAGAVTWAYPVTVDRTPHRLTFDSGEGLYAA